MWWIDLILEIVYVYRLSPLAEKGFDPHDQHTAFYNRWELINIAPDKSWPAARLSQYKYRIYF